MFKKLLAAGLGLAMTVSMMTGCSLVSDGSSSSDTKTEESAAADSSEDSSEADSTADASKEESEDAGSGDLIEKKMALFMTHMSNEFTVTLSNAAKDEAAERGYALNIYDANQDAQNQADQIEQAITLGVEGIIIEPVSVDGVVPSVKAAKEAGVNVVIVNQRISDPEAADCYVGADAATTGSKLMEEVMKDIDGKGNVALLLGPMGSDGQVGRSEGFDQVLADYPDVSVAFQDTAEWQTEPALTIVENWLNAGKEISAVVAQNDSMAVGAAKAIADAQKTGLILPLGIAAFIVFYVVFLFAIKKFDLKTPGREDDDDLEAEKNIELANDDYTAIAAKILEGCGGKENITSIDNCITRLRLEVKDITAVNDKVIKSAGVAGVIKPGKTSVQVIIGTKVQFVADAFSALCK